MADPQIEKLLIVQDRDIALSKIEQELTRIPKERASLEAQIKAEEDNVETARMTLKGKEVQRSELDKEVQAKEESIKRFRNQQLDVKKNEEYRALTHQIEQAESEVSELEEAEIGLMLEIDQEKENFETAKAKIDERIKERRRQIELLAEREANMKASLEDARVKAAAARVGVDESYLGHYERVKKLAKRAPFVVEIVDHKCCGCHLRVSNEVSRGARDAGEPHFCDQCARMVYC